MTDLLKRPDVMRAVELYALNPEITASEIAKELNVSTTMIYNWRKNPNFVDAIYERYMVEFGAELPAVLSAMIREAKAGNVQAARLILEHAGKLVKNINVTIDSPFEKFLKAEEAEVEYMDAEVQDIVEDIEEIQDIALPERKVEDQKKRTQSEFKTIKQAAQTSKRRMNRNKMHRWKQRAKAVGIEPLPAGRPTKAQKKEWIELVRAKEREQK